MGKKLAAIVAIAAAMSLAVTLAEASTPRPTRSIDGGGGHVATRHSRARRLQGAGKPSLERLAGDGAIIEKQVNKTGSQTSSGGTVRVSSSEAPTAARSLQVLQACRWEAATEDHGEGENHRRQRALQGRDGTQDHRHHGGCTRPLQGRGQGTIRRDAPSRATTTAEVMMG